LYLVHNGEFAVSDTQCDLTPHIQLWLVNMKDPSCQHLKVCYQVLLSLCVQVRLENFVEEFMKQPLPVPLEESDDSAASGSTVSTPQFLSLLQPATAISIEKGEVEKKENFETKEGEEVKEEENGESKETGEGTSEEKLDSHDTNFAELKGEELEKRDDVENKEAEGIVEDNLGSPNDDTEGKEKETTENDESKDTTNGGIAKNVDIESILSKSEDDGKEKGPDQGQSDDPNPKTPGNTKTPLEASMEYEDALQRHQEEAGRQIQAFVDDTVKLFKKHPFWQNANTSREKEGTKKPNRYFSLIPSDILWECIERYILTQVYRRVNVANKLRDWKFFQLASSFSFILPKHLDIKVNLPNELIAECGGMLTNMNFYKVYSKKIYWRITPVDSER
jgi:hypothetical protein